MLPVQPVIYEHLPKTVLKQVFAIVPAISMWSNVEHLNINILYKRGLIGKKITVYITDHDHSGVNFTSRLL